MNNSEVLTPELAADLLRQQEELQQETVAVMQELDLLSVLSRAGTALQIGSSVFGTMVWRDIDFSVVSPDMSIEHAFDVMRPLLVHPRVKQSRYLNEFDAFCESGLLYDERLYFALWYQSQSGIEWKFDISFWRSAERSSEADQLRLMLDSLHAENRLAILWIKDIWYRLPTYRQQVSSMDIYDAVLQHGVRTPGEFDEYLRAHGKPARLSL
jgi:hypothetical protein